MEVAKLEALRGCIHGTMIVAEHQTAGRGRGQGRVWQSELKGNLYFTYVLRPLSAQLLPVLNFALPLAVCMSIRQQTNCNAQIKWPNDIWIAGKKCCGMLLDVDVLSNAFVVSAGVGVNVNEDMQANPDTSVRETATSLFNATGRYISREALLAAICNHLERLLLQYTSVRDILPEYTKYDMLQGQTVVVMPKKREDTASYYDALCIGYTQDGYMRVKLQSGEEKILVSEEVSIRPARK